MTARANKLARLAQIAELKSTLAKGQASRILAKSKRLAAETESLQSNRQARAGQIPDPAGVKAHSAWLRQCDDSIRTLRTQEARVRVDLETNLDRARFEEGRRQVLERLKSQAS